MGLAPCCPFGPAQRPKEDGLKDFPSVGFKLLDTQMDGNRFLRNIRPIVPAIAEPQGNFSHRWIPCRRVSHVRICIANAQVKTCLQGMISGSISSDNLQNVVARESEPG